MAQSVLNASDIMTRNVVAAREDMSITAVAAVMLENHFSGVPVLGSDGRLTGIVTEGDLLRRVELGTSRKRSRWADLFMPASVAQDYVLAHGRRVGEIMTRDIFVVGPDTPLADIVAVMEDRRIKRVPVVENGRLVGIVSRADLLKALVALTRDIPEENLSDEQILASVLAEIRKQPWSTRNAGATVENGIVYLYGVVYDHREHIAMRVAAANVPGVKGIRDELQCIEPISGVPIETAEEFANLPPT